MQVFWAKGYEGAQLNDLTAAIGVKPPSFYATFGSKEAAFREAVDLYIARIGGAQMRVLDATRILRDSLRAMLEGSVEVALSTKPDGTEIDRLAAFYHGVLQAISFQARDGATRDELRGLIDPALRGLDVNCPPPHGPGALPAVDANPSASHHRESSPARDRDAG